MGAPCLLCLLAPEVAPFELPGLVPLELAGAGGMGSVWKARDVRLDRLVAVKLLHDVADRPRLAREARILAALAHPNVVAIHELISDGARDYLVMEWVEGAPLRTGAPLPIERTIEIGLALCDALACAHALGIVHRDVNPNNILVRDDGRIKLLDFGISRKAQVGWTVTSAHSVAGTPYYAAPEALAGAAPDPRMDVYAVGVILYELVTGALPLGVFARLPGRLDEIIRRALAADPAARFPDARALGVALGGAVPDRRRARRRRRAPMVALAATLAIIVPPASGSAVRSVIPPRVEITGAQPAPLGYPRSAQPAIEPPSITVVDAVRASAPRSSADNAVIERRPVRQADTVAVAITALPWALVSVDGASPIRVEPPGVTLVLRRGSHKIAATNPVTGATASRAIMVSDRGAAPVRFDLRAAAGPTAAATGIAAQETTW